MLPNSEVGFNEEMINSVSKNEIGHFVNNASTPIILENALD